MAKEPRVVLNASNKVVVAKYDSGTYKFDPGARLEIRNGHAVTHILDRWGQYGLVDITWDKALDAQYADSELYVHQKQIEGLYRMREALEETIARFDSYFDECGDKKTAERVRFLKQKEFKKKELDELDAYILAVENKDPQKMLDDKARELKRRAEELLKEAAKISGNYASKSKGSN